ncbi:hypothetical protein LX36DRAFT_347025 [Colletotrichum falcatum]|nr:hypothetical protein LX36DRAFT_347025 [Colletotrichum falcatum]
MARRRQGGMRRFQGPGRGNECLSAICQRPWTPSFVYVFVASYVSRSRYYVDIGLVEAINRRRGSNGRSINKRPHIRTLPPRRPIGGFASGNVSRYKVVYLVRRRWGVVVDWWSNIDKARLLTHSTTSLDRSPLVRRQRLPADWLSDMRSSRPRVVPDQVESCRGF